jgi:hypothetical protein
MVTGDFNRSWTGGAKSASNTLFLDEGALQQVTASQELLLPINATSNLEVGAISMILHYPADKVDVQGVFLGSGTTHPVMYSAQNGELRIGWNAMNPILVNNGEALITLRLRTSDNLPNNESIRFELAPDPLNELADALGTVNPYALLTVDVLTTATIGTGDNPAGSEITLGNYPNPFNGQTTFIFNLPTAGDLTLEIYNMVGQRVHAMAASTPAGNHTYTIEPGTLSSGVYMATLTHVANGVTSSRTIKIVAKN